MVSKRYHPQCKIHDSVSVCQFLYDLTSYLKSIYIDFYSTGVVHISIYVHNPGRLYMDCFMVQQGLESRDRDTLPLGAQTLQIHGFELVSKSLEICRSKQIFANFSYILKIYKILHGFFCDTIFKMLYKYPFLDCLNCFN